LEKNTKEGITVCKMLINIFLEKSALKGTRQRFQCLV